MMPRINYWLWFALLLIAPFSVRTLIVGTDPFNEYLSVFLYISDIVLVLFVITLIPRIIPFARQAPAKFALFFFLTLAIVSLVSSSFAPESISAAIRLKLFVAAALGGAVLMVRRTAFIASAIVISIGALILATVGITQFTAQSAVGLKVLGESPIHVLDPGTAKITVEGATLIRSYSLMPDPNVFAGFLVVGLCALAYLFCTTDKGLYVDAFMPERSLQANARAYVKSPLLYARLVLAAAFFVVCMALVFTFSRSGWFSASVALIVFAVLQARVSIRSAARFGALLVISAGALYFFFSPLIMPRARVSTSEPSFSYRMEYAKIGVSQLTSHPLIGVGVGSGVSEGISEGRYAAHGMSHNWEHQPVHNLYLLIAAEIGVLGAAGFLVFVGIIKWRLLRQKGSIEAVFALSLLSGLLVFGFFDHFLWDLQPGRFMLWLAVALALAAISRPSAVGASR